MCHTSNLKALQPGFFSKSQVQMSYPVDGNSAYSLSYRENYSSVCSILRETLASCQEATPAMLHPTSLC